MIKFTVIESQWLHSEGAENSYLLREGDGKRCCLGFLANACGFSDEELLGMGALNELNRPIQFLSTVDDGVASSYLTSTSEAINLMIINDEKIRNSPLPNENFYENKKAILVENFAEIGYELVFVP